MGCRAAPLAVDRGENAVRLPVVAVFLVLGIPAVSLAAQQGAGLPAGQSASPQQGQPTTAAPLPTPPITGPLQAAPPHIIEGGPLGKLSWNGIVSGMGLWQGNPAAGDKPTQAALSNGELFIQKTDGWWQFYVQAGAYTIPSLGIPFISTEKAITDLYSPVPVAFLKLVLGKSTSILVGSLPGLVGAEYTFDFENMNVQRGLL